MNKVYLAGPIAGLTFNQAQDWRDYAAEMIEGYDLPIRCFSPLRGKEYLDNGNIIGMQAYDEHVLSSAKGVIARDGNDVRTCDLLFVNVDGVTSISGGTAWELGVAWALNKIVVMVAANDGNPYLKHLILSQVPAFIVPTLDEGIAVTKAVLLN